MFTEVTLRENAASSLSLRTSDYKSSKFLSKADQGDNIKVEFKCAGSDFTQVFGGWIEELTPSLIESELLDVLAFGYGIGLVNMVVRHEYGSQSVNSGFNKIQEILLDIGVPQSHGIIPAYVHKVMGNLALASGYSYDTSKIPDLTSDFKFLSFTGKPAVKCIEDMINLMRAANAPNAGVHWIVIPDGTTAYLCLATIGAHENPPADIWPTWWNTDRAGSTIEVKKNMVVSQFRKAAREANYVLFTGDFLHPTGEIWTENHSSDWAHDGGAAGALNDEDTIKVVNSYSLKASLASAGPAETANFYYPGSGALNIHVGKFGTSRSIPRIAFYIYQTDALSRLTDGPQIRLYTTDLNNYFYQDISDLVTSTGKWFHISLPIGEYYALKEEPGTRFWEETGNPDWANIDFIGFWWEVTGAGSVIHYIDDLGFHGILTRAAYDSTKIASQKCKIMLIRDNVAKGDSLYASDDSGQIAQFAKAELARAISTPYVGDIVIPMQETILPGQLAHIHFGKKKAGTFNIDKDVRIIEPKHQFSQRGALTYLTLTDDVKSSMPRHPTDLYNQLVKAVGPQFQNRTYSSILSDLMDVEQTILAVDYDTSGWF